MTYLTKSELIIEIGGKCIVYKRRRIFSRFLDGITNNDDCQNSEFSIWETEYLFISVILNIINDVIQTDRRHYRDVLRSTQLSEYIRSRVLFWNHVFFFTSVTDAILSRKNFDMIS